MTIIAGEPWYGEIRTTHEQKYLNLQGYAFIPDEGPVFPERLGKLSIGEKRGVFVDEEPVTVGRLLLSEVNLRGTYHPMGGIADIATMPENRRKGYLKLLLSGFLEELKETGHYFSLLWPSSYKLYNKFDFQLSGHRKTYHINFKDYVLTQEIREALKVINQGNTKGDFYPIKNDEELSILNEIYTKNNQKFNMSLKRSESWWKAFVTEQSKLTSGKLGYIYAYKGNQGWEGYIIYTFESASRGYSELNGTSDEVTVMNVRELVCNTKEAYYKFLELVADHNLQADSVTISGVTDDYLQDKFEEPSRVKCEILPGSMFRIVDIETAFEGLAYEETIKNKLAIEVVDNFLPNNTGVYSINIEQGKANIQPAKREPDISLNIGSLSQLFSGYAGPETLYELNRLTIYNLKKLETFSKMFPRYAIFPIEYF